MGRVRVLLAAAVLLCLVSVAFAQATEPAQAAEPTTTKAAAPTSSGSAAGGKAVGDAAGGLKAGQVVIAASSDVVTGLFIGFFLIGMMMFGITMLTDIQASDTLGQPKPQIN